MKFMKFNPEKNSSGLFNTSRILVKVPAGVSITSSSSARKRGIQCGSTRRSPNRGSDVFAVFGRNLNDDRLFEITGVRSTESVSRRRAGFLAGRSISEITAALNGTGGLAERPETREEPEVILRSFTIRYLGTVDEMRGRTAEIRADKDSYGAITELIRKTATRYDILGSNPDCRSEDAGPRARERFCNIGDIRYDDIIYMMSLAMSGTPDLESSTAVFKDQLRRSCYGEHTVRLNGVVAAAPVSLCPKYLASARENGGWELPLETGDVKYLVADIGSGYLDAVDNPDIVVSDPWALIAWLVKSKAEFFRAPVTADVADDPLAMHFAGYTLDSLKLGADMYVTQLCKLESAVKEARKRAVKIAASWRKKLRTYEREYRKHKGYLPEV